MDVSENNTSKIKTLDVFTGIGGITHGLAPFCQPVMYCEVDKYCHAVLAERMASGDLERAPVHSDIRTLHLPSNGMDVDMICGGFPCQDISSIGLQRGIVEGHRSSMFFEMMRIVDESPSIRMVFLENVGNIMMCGFVEVMQALTSRGFDMAWTMRAATAFGAPHCRNRWFCLAVKQGSEVTLGETLSSEQCVADAVAWYDDEPCKRYTAKPLVSTQDETFDPLWIQRCHTLGNAVVPCVVRTVFSELLATMSKRHKFADCMAPYARPVTECMDFPEQGMIIDHNIIQLPKQPPTKPAFTNKKVTITIRSGDKLLKMDRFPTPRRGITHANNVTDRTIRDLPTVLINCIESVSRASQELDIPLCGDTDSKKARIINKPMTYLLPNVEYIEWMMNFPKNWTRISPETNVLYPKLRVVATRPNNNILGDINKKNNDTDDDEPSHQHDANETTTDD